jgi:phosphoglycerate dehydrogenase-like enzyme
MKKGEFAAHFKNFELLGKTIGIVGVGRVGSYVARIARSFNMNILGNDIKSSVVKKYKWIKFLSLNKLLRTSDIISIHTPLDKTTVNLLNRNNLQLLKKNAILINCARGGIVSENDLLDFLKKKRFYYAGIDVYVNEPKVNPKFRTLQNVVLTPHLAGKTVESKQRISVQLAEKIVSYFSKKSKSNPIN